MMRATTCFHSFNQSNPHNDDGHAPIWRRRTARNFILYFPKMLRNWWWTDKNGVKAFRPLSISFQSSSPHPHTKCGTHHFSASIPTNIIINRNYIKASEQHSGEMGWEWGQKKNVNVAHFWGPYVCLLNSNSWNQKLVIFPRGSLDSNVLPFLYNGEMDEFVSNGFL